MRGRGQPINMPSGPTALAGRLDGLGLGSLAAALAQPNGLADPVAEIVQLGPPGNALALDLDLADSRRVQWELPLDALALHDPANGERLAATGARAGNHRAIEDLRPLFVAFQDADMHVHRVADLKRRQLRLQARLLDLGQDFLTHGSFLSPGVVTPGRGRSNE